MRASTWLGGAAIAAGLVAVLAVLIAIAQQLVGPTGAVDARGSQYITIYGAAQSFVLCSVLAAILIDDRANGEPISPLFSPVFALKVVLMMLLSMLTVTAVDVLLHGVRTLHWKFMFDPDVRLLLTFLYLALPLALTWYTVVVLRGRGVPQRVIWAVLVTPFVLTVAAGIAITLVKE